MLTADLVLARRYKGTLRLPPLSPEQRERALDIADQLCSLAHAHIGQSRDELMAAWATVDVGAKDRKLGLGLRKLIEDGLEFDAGTDLDPVALRRQVFELATVRRRELADDARLDRGTVLAEVAHERGLTVEAVEAGLYGDLKGAHTLTAVSGRGPAALIADYDLEQARAVLLRAARVSARIAGASPDAVRSLFQKLKFHRLLHTVTTTPDGALRVDIDGPFSLFDSVTKYGLALALALPALTSCGEWSLDADIRWGKSRTPMTFQLSGAPRPDDAEPPRLRDEVQTLLDRMRDRAPWSARIATEVIDLPGVGLCVPDLELVHADSGEVVYLEVLGFWSRAAVWKRVELVEQGLKQRMLFAVPSRLRVSEQALDDDLPSALYVYKQVMSPKAIEAKLDAIAAR